MHCDSSKRPADQESCALQPCEYVWITGEWSEVRPGDSVTGVFRSTRTWGKHSDEGRNVGDLTHLPVLPVSTEVSHRPLLLPGPEPHMCMLEEGPQVVWAPLNPSFCDSPWCLVGVIRKKLLQGLQIHKMPLSAWRELSIRKCLSVRKTNQHMVCSGTGPVPFQLRPCRNMGLVLPHLTFQERTKIWNYMWDILMLNCGLRLVIWNIVGGKPNTFMGQMWVTHLTTSDSKEQNNSP